MEEEEGARRGGGWTEEEEGAEEEGKKASHRGERRASTADSAAPLGPGPPTPPGHKGWDPAETGYPSARPACPYPAPRAWWSTQPSAPMELGWGQVGPAFGTSRLTATAPAGDPGQCRWPG